MYIGDHSRQDRLAIAGLCGILGRRAIQLTAGQCTLAEAVAELHASTTDPHLLSHAVSPPGQPWAATIRDILTEAGADPAELTYEEGVKLARHWRG